MATDSDIENKQIYDNQRGKETSRDKLGVWA